MVPAGAALPANFPNPLSGVDALSFCLPTGDGCKARLIDLNDDGRDELLIAHRFAIVVFARGDDDRWTLQGSYLPRTCAGLGRGDMREALEKDTFRKEPPRWPNLASGEATRWTFSPDTNCAGEGDKVSLVEPVQPAR